MVQSGASGCEKGFVKRFLKVPLACLGSMAAAVQPNGLGNSQKTVYKTFWTSGRPTQDKPNRINIAKEEIDEDGVFVVYSFFSIAKPSLTSFFSDSDEITKLWNLHWHKLTDARYWWCWMFSFSLALLPPAGRWLALVSDLDSWGGAKFDSLYLAGEMSDSNEATSYNCLKTMAWPKKCHHLPEVQNGSYPLRSKCTYRVIEIV